MPNVLLAYHFLSEDMTTNFGNEPPWTVGESRSVAGEIIPCKSGYHGSPTLWDALTYAPGPVACLVELSGDVQPHGDPVDKYAASTRKLLAAVNIETELRLFAADCAEHVLPIYEAAYPDDDRPRRAIEAARAFARGEIDEVAWDAARAVAVDAALAARAGWGAAVDAAWDAVAAAGAAEKAWQREQFGTRFAHLFDREDINV